MITDKLNLEGYEVNTYLINKNSNLQEIYFSHANGFNALTYSSLVSKIKNDYQIISYDMRGHGNTSLPADHSQMKSWFTYKDDLEKILGERPYKTDNK